MKSTKIKRNHNNFKEIDANHKRAKHNQKKSPKTYFAEQARWRARMQRGAQHAGVHSLTYTRAFTYEYVLPHVHTLTHTHIDTGRDQAICGHYARMRL